MTRHRPPDVARVVLILVALLIVCFGPAMTQTSSPTAILYRLESGSSYQRGCLDPTICDVPQPIPLVGTFTASLGSRDFDFERYEITDVNWRNASGGDPLALGHGNLDIHSSFAVYEVMSLSLAVAGVATASFVGRVDGTGGFPRIEMTLKATLGPNDDAVLTVKASPVSPVEIQWYRLIGRSTYQQRDCDPTGEVVRPLTGTFGLVELQAGSTELAVVLVRFSADPVAGSSDPSHLFLTGSGGGPGLSMLLSEDGRTPFLMIGTGELPAGRVSLAGFSLTGGRSCVERIIHLRAQRE